MSGIGITLRCSISPLPLALGCISTASAKAGLAVPPPLHLIRSILLQRDERLVCT
jgi:hypothetical protein